MHFDFHLALGGDVGEASAAGVAVDGDDGEAVACGAADALVGGEVALVDELFLFFGFFAEAFLVFFSFGDDRGEFVAFGVEVFCAVVEELFGGGDMFFEFFDFGGALFVFTFAELDFEVLEFYFFSEGLVFAVVADVVLLFLVFFDLFLVVGDFGVAGLVGGIGFLDIGVEVVDAGVEAGDFVLEVLDGLGSSPRMIWILSISLSTLWRV